jgi:hypothetical protein
MIALETIITHLIDLLPLIAADPMAEADSASDVLLSSERHAMKRAYIGVDAHKAESEAINNFPTRPESR